MADKKALAAKEIEKKIVDLKIELLKNPTKKGSIKREIARMLTMRKTVEAGKTDAAPKGVSRVQMTSAKADKLDKTKLAEEAK